MAHTYVIYGLIRPHIEALFIIYWLFITEWGPMYYSGVRLQQLVKHSMLYCTLPDLRHESHVLIRNEGHFHFYYCLWHSDKK
jgi:hypothetical protein